MSNCLVIGGRASLLSRIQVYQVALALKRDYPKLNIDYHFQNTAQEKEENLSLSQISEKGIFVKELQEKLIEHRLDALVHSWKDLPTLRNPHTIIMGVLDRADQRDILFFKKEYIQNPPKEIIIYTSSPRRKFLLQQFLPKGLPKNLQDLPIKVQDIRGNVPTRFRKFMTSSGQGLVLTKGAIDRLLETPLDKQMPEDFKLEITELRKELLSYFKNLNFMILTLSEFPNAPAQGALAVELRSTDYCLHKLFKPMSNISMNRLVEQERDIARLYGSTCHSQLGVACIQKFYGTTLHIKKSKQDNKEIKNLKYKSLSYDINSKLLKNLQKSREHYSFVYYRNKKIHLPRNKMHAWPISQEDQEIVSKRSALKLAEQYAKIPPNILVSRKEAWPREWSSQGESTVCVSGMKTWKALAEKDIWVSACSNSLDEWDLNSLVKFQISPSPFIKIGHRNSSSFSSLKMKTVPTYELEFSRIPSLAEIKAKTHFFWRSASQFHTMTEHYPHILDLYHASMPGSTSQYIMKKIKNKDRLDIYLQYTDWLEEIENL